MLSKQVYERHVPCVLVYDARGNGGGGVVPTLTGEHESSISDYTAIVLIKYEEDDMLCREEIL